MPTDRLRGGDGWIDAGPLPDRWDKMRTFISWLDLAGGGHSAARPAGRLWAILVRSVSEPGYREIGNSC